MTRHNGVRRGAILLEVMVGLLVLAIAGIGWITLMGQTAQTVHQVRLRERDYEAAADDLAHAALWTPEEFNARVGSSRVGSYVLTVEPLAADLFTVAIADTVGATLLSTSMYAADNVDSAAH